MAAEAMMMPHINNKDKINWHRNEHTILVPISLDKQLIENIIDTLT